MNEKGYEVLRALEDIFIENNINLGKLMGTYAGTEITNFALFAEAGAIQSVSTAAYEVLVPKTGVVGFDAARLKELDMVLSRFIFDATTYKGNPTVKTLKLVQRNEALRIKEEIEALAYQSILQGA